MSSFVRYVGSGFPVPPKPRGGEGGSRTYLVKSAVSVRIIDATEGEEWARVAAEGWRESGFADFILAHGRVQANVAGMTRFLAEIDGTPIAAAALGLSGGVAHLAGASTVPAARKQGAQLALLDARLRYAAGQGCDLALMGALPGSGSQRNAERHGFRIAYTRIKWRLTT
jgi:GNAT superfamily N-acetyltransferase